MIKPAHPVVFTVEHHGIIFLKRLQHTVEHNVHVGVAPRYLAQRHRIGRIAAEHPLVDIDARTEYAVLHEPAAYRCLYESAAYLAVVPIHIVGPFQRHSSGNRVESILHGKRLSHGQRELTRRRNTLRSHQHGEQQIASVLALPPVGAHAASGGLMSSRHDHNVRVRQILHPAQISVGGVHLIKPYRVYIHLFHIIRSGLNASSICSMCGSPPCVPVTVMMSKRSSSSTSCIFT